MALSTTKREPPSLPLTYALNALGPFSVDSYQLHKYSEVQRPLF